MGVFCTSFMRDVWLLGIFEWALGIVLLFLAMVRYVRVAIVEYERMWSG